MGTVGVAQSMAAKCPASSKRFLRIFWSIFELGGITIGDIKDLMTGPAGNSEFVFLAQLQCSLRVSG